jgi:hypothetical protein
MSANVIEPVSAAELVIVKVSVLGFVVSSIPAPATIVKVSVELSAFKSDCPATEIVEKLSVDVDENID